MKALLIKDILTIWKQLKLMLLLILVFSVMASDYQNIFAVIYAAMIPYIAIAYDERSRWNRMALMMPFSARDMVWSKYVLGLIFSVGTLFLALLIRFAISSTRSMPFEWVMLVLGFIGSMIIMDITLPLMFRFGVEKGRVIMIFMIFLICGGTSAVTSMLKLPTTSNTSLILPGLITSAVLTAVSVWLSSKMYGWQVARQ